MKFYHPETEQRLLRLAHEGLGSEGGTMQTESGSGWSRAKKFGISLVWQTLAVTMLLFLLGATSAAAALRVAEWQMLLSGSALLMSALVLSQQLGQLQFHPPMAQVLMHLPVPGSRLARWGQEEVLKEMTKRISLLLVCAWAMGGFPWRMRVFPGVVVHAVMLGGMVLATTMLVSHPWIKRLRLPRAWLLVLVFTLCVCVWLYIRKSHLPAALPGWLLHLAEGLSWLLPMSWVHPARLYGLGGFLALLWGVWGFLCWRRWPEQHGALLDQPLKDSPALALLEEDAEEDEPASLTDLDQAEDPAGCPTDAPAVEAGDGLYRGPMPVASQMPQDGWIERLAFRLMPAQDLPLAAAVMTPHPGWVRLWKLAVKASLVLLAFAGALKMVGQVFPILDPWVSVAQGWVWALTAGELLVLTFPFAHQIPTAVIPWRLGQHWMPFFSSLPLGMRDLLRISSRLTLALCVPFMLLAVPVMTLMAFVTGLPEHTWFAVRAVPVLAVMWFFSRPLTLHFRMSTVCRHRKGAAWSRLFTEIVVALFCVVWLFTIIVIPIVAWVTEPSAALLLDIILGMLANAISARAVFEIFHWRLRTGRIDFLREGV